VTSCASAPSNCVMPATYASPDAIRGRLPPRYLSKCEAQVLQVPSLAVFPLGVRCGGDGEMDGNHPTTTIQSNLSLGMGGALLDVAADVMMKEGRSDWTCFRGSAKRTVLNLAMTYPGCFVSKIGDITPYSGSLTHTSGEDDHSWQNMPNGVGLIARATCRSDTNGNDTGRLGCTAVEFNPVTVKLAHEEQRSSAKALVIDARRSWENRPKIRRNLATAEAASREVVAKEFQAKAGHKPSWGLERAASPVVAPKISPTIKFQKAAPPTPQ
jgi:hypothetical protein